MELSLILNPVEQIARRPETAESGSALSKPSRKRTTSKLHGKHYTHPKDPSVHNQDRSSRKRMLILQTTRQRRYRARKKDAMHAHQQHCETLHPSMLALERVLLRRFAALLQCPLRLSTMGIHTVARNGSI